MSRSKHINPAYELGHPSQLPALKAKLWQSENINEAVFQFYYDWLYQLSCSRFDWQGLPNDIDERYLELSLNGFGLAAFFYDPEYDHYFGLRATPSGNINPYQNPKAFTVFGSNGYHKRLQAEDMVAIWNNYTRTPTTFGLMLYARKLSNIDRTIDVNLNAQKMPVFITCDESQRLTVENMIKQTYGNEPIIIGDSLSVNGVNIGYISADVPYIASSLLKDKAMIWNEIMSYLGIDNSNVSKPERVQSAEVSANDSQIEKSGLISLDCRRWACEEINRKYGLETWVDMSTDFSSMNFAALMALPSENIEGFDHVI